MTSYDLLKKQIKKVDDQISFFSSILENSPEITNINLDPIVHELKVERIALEKRLDRFVNNLDSSHRTLYIEHVSDLNELISA